MRGWPCFAVALMAPLGAQAADPVVDEAVAEIIAAFEQETGKQVELEQPSENEIGAKAQAAVEAGHPPDFLFGLWITPLLSPVGLRGLAGRPLRRDLPFASLFDPDALAFATLLDATTGRRALYALPMGIGTDHVHVWRNCSSRQGSLSMTSPSSGRRSGRSGAMRSSRQCAG